MAFENLYSANLLMYAMKHYDNPACHTTNEFIEDYDRVKYIKRLFKRYQTKGVLKERLILNHIIIVYNVFGPDAGTRILFCRLESELWPILKTFLVFLNLLPEIIHGIAGKDIGAADVPLDAGLIKKLRAI